MERQSVYDANLSYHIMSKRTRGPAIVQSVESWYCLRWECHNCPMYDPFGGFERAVGRLHYVADNEPLTSGSS